MEACEPKQQQPVGQSRVVDAVAVADETTPVATHVEQRTPIRAVAYETGDLDGQDRPDRAEGHARDQLPKALPGESSRLPQRQKVSTCGSVRVRPIGRDTPKGMAPVSAENSSARGGYDAGVVEATVSLVR